MKIRFEKRDSFRVSGFAVETNLDSAVEDIAYLWKNYEKQLLSLVNDESPLYGLMWYTKDHNYFYLLGIEDNDNSITSNVNDISNANSNNENSKNEVVSIDIPSACFGIATIPEEMDGIEAWTRYFEVELPKLAYLPDGEHGKYFESYFDGVCEFWTPVKKIS